MAFRFRLQRWLTYSLFKEQAKKVEVGKLQRDLEELENKSETLENSVNGLLRRDSESSVAWMQYRAEKIKRDMVVINDLSREHEKQSKLLEQKRTELYSVGQRRKGLETLKERHRKQFVSEKNKREERAVSELFLSRLAAKRTVND